jgi:hypothetical protein
VVLEQTVSATAPPRSSARKSSAHYAISGGLITVPIASMVAVKGYHLVVAPGSSSAFSGTYTIKSVNSGLLPGIQNMSIGEGGDALVWSDGG